MALDYTDNAPSPPDIPFVVFKDRPIQLLLGDDEPIRNLGKGFAKAIVVLVPLLTVFFHVPHFRGQYTLCTKT